MTTKIREILQKIHKKDLVLPVILMAGLLVITLVITVFLNRAERFYYENRKALILTDSFLYLNQGGKEDGRVDYFTTISEDNSRFLLEDGRNVSLGGGLLHDGKDVFIFLEDATVTYNGKTKDIGPLSYVVCFQGQSILICNYGEDAISEDLDTAGASAVLKNGTTVDLANDVYYRANGTKFLMFTEPSLFELVQEKGES